MATLEELKRENERLRNIQRGINEMRKMQEERVKLVKQNKSLSRNIKYGRTIKTGKTVTKKVSRGVATAGRGILKGLQRYGNYIEEQKRKQDMLNKRLKKRKRR